MSLSKDVYGEVWVELQRRTNSGYKRLQTALESNIKAIELTENGYIAIPSHFANGLSAFEDVTLQRLMKQKYQAKPIERKEA